LREGPCLAATVVMTDHTGWSEAGQLSEDALRNADSVNDLRLQIKLHSKRGGQTNLAKGTEHLRVMKDGEYHAMRTGARGESVLGVRLFDTDKILKPPPETKP
jgi:hypothetical protein